MIQDYLNYFTTYLTDKKKQKFQISFILHTCRLSIVYKKILHTPPPLLFLVNTWEMFSLKPP